MGHALQANWAAKTAMGFAALFGASAFAASDAEASCINRLVKVPGTKGVNVGTEFYSGNYRAAFRWSVGKPLVLKFNKADLRIPGISSYQGDVIQNVKHADNVCTDIGKILLNNSDALYLETYSDQCKPGSKNPEQDRKDIAALCNKKERIYNTHPAKPGTVASLEEDVKGFSTKKTFGMALAR